MPFDPDPLHPDDDPEPLLAKPRSGCSVWAWLALAVALAVAW
jgi:hypothetical protein